jgi:hypothetical protein
MTRSSNRLRQRAQSRAGSLDLIGVERGDGGIDGLDQRRQGQRACYIATRPLPKPFSGALATALASPQSPDLPPESTLWIAPTSCIALAGPPFDSRRLHFS